MYVHVTIFWWKVTPNTRARAHLKYIYVLWNMRSGHREWKIPARNKPKDTCTCKPEELFFN